MRTRISTYLGILVGSLLPLLGHGLGLRASKGVDGVENEERGNSELGHLEEDLPALTLGGLSAGTVRAKGNPISYSKKTKYVSEP